ncbi:hypothetical protein Tco_0766145 [Tanacetum coccineum]
MTFRTRYGHYKFQVMPFGQTNAPAVGGGFDAKREGDSLRIPPTQGSREELHYLRFGAWICGVRSKDLEALPILNAQAEALKEENVKEENLNEMDKKFEIRADGTHCIEKRSWVPRFGGLKDTSPLGGVHHTTTVNTTQQLRLLHSRLCMAKSVDHLFVGQKLEIANSLTSRSFMKQPRRSSRLKAKFKLLEIVKRVMPMKENKDKSEQNQSKPTKKRKRQDKSEEWKPILKAGSTRYNKERKSMKLKMKVKGPIVTSLQSLRANLEVSKFKGPKLQKLENWFIKGKRK